MITVGQTAAQDPILGYSSAVAANLLRQAAARPARQRLGWLRSELNKATPGFGDDFVSRTRELRRRGRSQDQATFDALRLGFANRVRDYVERVAAARPGAAGGLGSSHADIHAVFCGLTSVITAGGSVVTGAMSDPAASTAIGTAGSAASTASGCNAPAAAQQAAAMVAQAQMEAERTDRQRAETRQTAMWVAGGVAATAVIGIIGIAVLRKK